MSPSNAIIILNPEYVKINEAELATFLTNAEGASLFDDPIIRIGPI